MKRALALTALACLGLVVGGCGSDQAAPSSIGSSPSHSSSPSEVASATPTLPAPTCTQAPATGQLVDLDYFRFNMPADWSPYPPFAPDDRVLSMTSDNIRENLRIGTSGDIGEPSSIDELAKSWQKTAGSAKGLTKMATVTISGQEWFHLAGERLDTVHTDIFGITYRGQIIVLTFDYDINLRTSRQEEVTGSVLASLVLK